jgi:hypothetical protein
MKPERSIVICGLPESGKTTFLAALWHLVTSKEISTSMAFESLRNGDVKFLNEIAERWRSAKVQERTKVKDDPTVVSMNLVDASSVPMRLTFPDVSGESFRRMWEDRECDVSLAKLLERRTGTMLFVHANTIVTPQWVVDHTAQVRALGLADEAGAPAPWNPRFAPTQVQLVELLQFLRRPPLAVESLRLAIILSAWDKVEAEGRTPDVLLRERLPLLYQALSSERLGYDYRVYGVSAQGGDYEPPPEEAKKQWSREEVEELRRLDLPSKRIRITTGISPSHDLTEPISWLTE